MNIVCTDENMIVAKTCGCEKGSKQNVAYAFSDEFHSIYMDKKEILRAVIDSCERLSKYATTESEKAVVKEKSPISKRLLI
jgi:hypothetical protein